MRKILLPLLCTLCVHALHARTFEVKSPDGRIVLKVAVTDRIVCSVTADERPLFDLGPLALRLHDRTLGHEPRLVRHGTQAVDRSFTPAVAYKFREIRDRCNALRLDFRGGWGVEFRAYDDGAAYRFVTSLPGDVEVLDEGFTLTFPDACTAMVQLPGSFRTAYEEPYTTVGLGAWTPDRLAVLPALIDTKGGYKVLVSESALTDYPCLFLRGTGGNALTGAHPKVPLRTEESGDRSRRILEEAPGIARTAGTRAFPWRYAVIAREDGQLIENTMTARLAEACVLEDTSWIRPGQVSWEFWNAASPYGPDVDFVAGMNTATYRYFIDFAAHYGIPYLILDEGWAASTRDPCTPNPDVDLPALIRYGEERGVGLILWMTWLTVDKHPELFETLADRGIRGLKIDFMDRSDQWMVGYYERVAAAAAKHRMVVSFHGSFKPAGLEYKYPNVLTYEGVRGMENMGGCNPANTVWLPFIRNAVGPMDYTPGAMTSMHPESYCGARPNAAAVGTRAFQMALYVLFESGLQMLADSPTQYYRNDDCTRFVTGVPVTWDETRALSAEAGRYAVIARRKGDKWYVGAINGNNDRAATVEIGTDFLAPEREYTLTAFSDGPNAFRQAMDYRRERRTIRRGERLTLHLARNGGWAAVIE